MSKITKEKPTPEKLIALKVDTWSPWECEPGTFNWSYDTDETAYVLEGKVTMTASDGQIIEIGAGDPVHLSQDLN